MPPQRIPREESWNSVHHSEASGDASHGENGCADVSMEDESDHGTERSTTESPTFPTISDVHRALHPLQATADRVGKQVERFAETLDRLSIKKQKKPQKDCRHVLPLINAYKKIAGDTIQHLQSMHEPERRAQLCKKTKRRLQNSSSRSTPGGPTPEEDGSNGGMMTSVDDLKRWEQEEQTWDLLGLMLQSEYPLPESETSHTDFVRPSKSIEIHRYSSEKDVWDSFLASDNQAWERHVVVEWLKKCADRSGQDIEQVVKELESGADRGSGLWAHSWLYSKEAIKGQKRLRSWPRALEPDDPGLDTSLVNSEKNKALVTQLDPDAISRQGRSLEKQDYYFERATWLACWEMVRRGKDWDYVREWCQERVEGWRATAMRGDPRGSPFHTSSAASWQSRALWRKTCALAAKDGGIDEYENAVYGVLSGYLPSVQKVSRSWDDYLFAHYNSYLLYSFSRYVKTNFSDRVPSALADKHGSFNFSVFGGQRTQSGNQVVERMQNLDATKEEARKPFKMLQGNLIAKTFDDFAFKQGVRLNESANTKSNSKILPPMSVIKLLEGFVTAPLRMEDYDFLRLITHIIFIFQDLGFDFGDDNRRYFTENIVVAYVDYLGKAGKQQLLPLYASRLSSQRSVACLGRQLPVIHDRGERQTMMRLMKQESIDVPGVLNTQLQMIIMDDPSKEGSSMRYPNLRILEQNTNDPSKVRPVKSGFIGETITEDQQDLVHGFEWYMLLDGHWLQTMTVGAVLYKYLLRSQGLAAARNLSQTVTFSKLSLSKTKAILGRPVDISISKGQESSDDEAVGPTTRNTRSRHNRSQRRRRSSSGRRFSSERELLLDQASTFRDFETLFVALDAMEEWKRLADDAVKYIDQRQDSRLWKDPFQMAFNRVQTRIEPLLHGWLQSPRSDAEADEFKQIRVGCLPEIILAYNSVLEFSSYYLSRDLLLKSMDLAALIAEEDSDLAACFVAADRMPELVDSFALLSKTIIRADGRGAKTGKSKKKKNGETLDLWTVRAPSA